MEKMIFDRTSQDVVMAKKIRSEKIQKFLELTEDEQRVLERGFLLLSTIERIQQKQIEIKKIIEGLLYLGAKITIDEFNRNDFFRLPDLQTLIKNNESLIKAFMVYKNTPLTANAKFEFEQFNKIEKMLADMESLIYDIQDSYRICGTFDCG